MVPYRCDAFETDLAYPSCSRSRLPKLYLNNWHKAARGSDVTEADVTCPARSRKELLFPLLGSVTTKVWRVTFTPCLP